MNVSRAVNQWGPVALAVVCVFLGIRLVSELSGPPVHASRAALESAVPPAKPLHKQPRGSKEALGPVQEDPLVQLSLLKRIESRSLPPIARNPFDFAPLPPPKPTEGGAVGGSAEKGPPPPPPIPLKAIGYSEDRQGRRQAYLADTQQVYVVSQGTTVSKRFKVLQISPEKVEIEDANSGQKAELPIPKEK
jgi:hypothetical protein